MIIEIKKELEVNLKQGKVDIPKELEEKIKIFWKDAINAYGILAVGDLNMSKQEMEDFFLDYKNNLEKNGEEIEFKEIKFLPVNNAIEKLNNMPNCKRGYLVPLLELEDKRGIFKSISN